MKKALFVIVLLLIAGAYLAGYWPQRAHVQQAQQSASQSAQQLASAHELAQVMRIENDLLVLERATREQNYGQAQQLSGKFFDDLRQDIDKYPNASYTPTMQSILAQRDAITAGLTRADASTLATLDKDLDDIRQIADKLLAQANL
jgi:Na+-transporting NADH:ubiquinone oxidoreductase subunit NqrC